MSLSYLRRIIVNSIPYNGILKAKKFSNKTNYIDISSGNSVFRIIDNAPYAISVQKYISYVNSHYVTLNRKFFKVNKSYHI